jgi:sugar lactone lactonase YvrE
VLSTIDNNNNMMLWFYLLLFIGCNLALIQAQSNSIGWQSFLSLSNFGMTFSPSDEQALLLSDINVDSLEVCALTCHANIFCRILNFDGQENRCRLFEGDADITGTIIASSSPLSIVELIQLMPEQFSSKGRPCSFCEYSRYLTCINSTCQCPSRTYFDGSICRSQSLIGGQCINETDCRIDLNLTCLPRKQCGRKFYHKNMIDFSYLNELFYRNNFYFKFILVLDFFLSVSALALQYGVTVGGYSNGTAGNASDALFNPFGIAIGNDDSLFVGEFGNARVIRISVGSLIGTIVAGTGIKGNASSQLNDPSNLYVDAASNIYVSDTSNGRAMLWPNGSSTGVSVTGTTIISSRIFGITMDSRKNIYIVETDHHRVTKWAPNATNGTVVAGTGVSGNDSQHLSYPFGLYLDELHSYLYVSDYYNNRIQRFTLGVSMNGTTVAGGNGPGSSDNQLYQPQGLCVSKKTGAIYIADTYNNRVTQWNPGATSGVTIAGIAGINGTNATLLYGPADVALSTNETYLYVSDLNNNRIQRFELI